MENLKFKIRQTSNGILRGEMELDENSTLLYQKSADNIKHSIIEHLNESASKHFKTECYVTQLIERNYGLI